MNPIYLAARYSRRSEMLGYAADLSLGGIGDVRARWLFEDHDWPGDTTTPEAIRAAQRFAQDDWEDLQAAHLVIVFSELPTPGGRNRGGRHVEFGLALGWDKPTIVVGPPENVFMMLPGLRRYDTWAQAFEELVAVRALDPFEQVLAMGQLRVPR